MKVAVKDAGTCRKTMKIEVPAEAVATERVEMLKAYARSANIPGFRKGKAPAHVVARKYGPEINKDLEERLVPKFYHEALKESDLKVVNIVGVSDAKVVEEQPLAFEVTVDVEPEFKLPKYVDIPVKEEKEEVSDAQVQERIDSLRREFANFEEVQDRPVAAGDMAQIAYSATVDGKPLNEMAPAAKGVGAGSGYWVSADEHAFLPGMGEALIGMSIGGKKQVPVAFPETFIVKELAGVKALYDIEVTAVRVRTLATIDETFLARLQVESEEALRARIREQLEQMAEQRSLNAKHDQIVDFLLKKTKLDVPESVVQQQTRNIVYDMARQRLMLGQTQEQIGAQQEEMFKEAQGRAIDNVKLRYIGLGIAKELGLEASAREIDEEIASMAVRQRKDARALRREMEEDGSIQSVGEQIRFNKALDHMLANAKIK